MNIQPVTMLDDAIINAPFGQVRISLRHARLMIELFSPSSPSLTTVTEITLEKSSRNPLVSLACLQVIQYLQQSDSAFNLPIEQRGTAFQQRVWEAIAAIPLGQTMTYGELAQQVGSGPRAVANACGANQLPLAIPCHRVVAKNGLGGFMQGKHNGLFIKQWLLQHEHARC